LSFATSLVGAAATLVLVPSRILEAHGETERWRSFSKCEVDALTGGGLFPLEGVKLDLTTQHMTMWLK
jgi:hypothetical protein